MNSYKIIDACPDGASEQELLTTDIGLITRGKTVLKQDRDLDLDLDCA